MTRHGFALLSPVQDFITQEFTQVYGRDNIAAVHLISDSRRTAKLVQQYNSTKSALQDLLDHYNTQLRHAAAASRRKQHQQDTAASRVLQGAAKPFKALGRALALIPGELPLPVLAPAVGSEAAQGAAAGRDVRLQAGAAGSNGSSSGGSGGCGGSDSARKQRHHGWLRHDPVKPIEVLQVGVTVLVLLMLRFVSQAELTPPAFEMCDV